MSASPRKRTKSRPYVRFVPQAVVSIRSKAALFDHLVGAGEQAIGHGEAQRFRGLEIDNEFVLRRRLHRKVGGLLALEDAIDVTGGAAELADKTRPIRDQPAGSDEKALVVECGQFVPSRQRDDQIAMSCRQWASRYDQAAIRAAREGRDGVLNLAWLAHAERTQFHSYRWRHGLDSAKLAGPGGYGGIAN